MRRVIQQFCAASICLYHPLLRGGQPMEDYIMAPLTCKDVLYRAFPVAPDPDVERMRNYCYVLCSQIRILELQSKRTTSVEEQKIFAQHIAYLQNFLQVSFIALRVGYFVFGPMRFRGFLSETQLRRKAG